MMGMAILAAVVCVLAALVLFNLALTFGLVRRLRMALEDGGIAPGGSIDVPGFPVVGSRVDPFAAQTLDGESLSDADLSAGPAVVAYFSVGCPACVKVKKKLLARGVSGPLTVIVAGEPGDLEAIALAEEFMTIAEKVAVVEQDSAAVEALRVEGYPTLVRLEDGVVQASGYKLDAIAAQLVPVG